MYGNIVVNTAILIRDSILFPRRLFEDISKGRFIKELFIAFSLGALITFSKSFFITRKTFTFEFFNSEVLNKVIVWFNNSQVSWLGAYVCYFIFIFFVFVMCSFFNKQVRFKQVAISLMSLSGFGVAMQIVFYVLKFAASKNLLLVGSYIVYIWLLFLSVLALRTMQNMSFLKAATCFLIPAMPFVFVTSFVGIAPYLIGIGK